MVMEHHTEPSRIRIRRVEEGLGCGEAIRGTIAVIQPRPVELVHLPGLARILNDAPRERQPHILVDLESAAHARERRPPVREEPSEDVCVLRRP